MNLTATNFNSYASFHEISVTETTKETRDGLGISLTHNYGQTRDAVQDADKGDTTLDKLSNTLKAVDAVTSFAKGPSGTAHLGHTKTKTTATQTNQAARVSTIDAGGNINITVTEDINVEGTNAISGGDIFMEAKNINIGAAIEVNTAQQDYEMTSNGVVANADQDSIGVGVASSIGTSDMSSIQENAVGALFHSGGSISLNTDQDITIEGAGITSVENINLNAGNDLTIKSAENSYESAMDAFSANAGAGAGITFSKDAPPALGFYVEGGLGVNELDRNRTTHNNASINAGGTLNITSGNDVTITGANVEGDDVLLDVGNNLTVTSVRDIGEVDGERFEIGGSVTVGGGASFSVNGGYGETNGSTSWVNEQTSIIGRSSVDIDVENHTQLDGALIANIDAEGIDQGNLDLDTQSFAHSSFGGHDKESSYYISASYGSGNYNEDDTSSVTAEGEYYNFDRRQINSATIGAGNITIRDDAQTGQDNTAGLNRDYTTAQIETKDKEDEFSFYASTSSVNALTNPVDSAKAVFNDLADYHNAALDTGRNTVAVVKAGGDVISDVAIGDFAGAKDAFASIGTHIQLAKYETETYKILNDPTANPHSKEVQDALNVAAEARANMTGEDVAEVRLALAEEFNLKRAKAGDMPVIGAANQETQTAYVSLGDGVTGTSISDREQLMNTTAHELAHLYGCGSDEGCADKRAARDVENFNLVSMLYGYEQSEGSSSESRAWLLNNQNDPLLIENTNLLNNENPDDLDYLTIHVHGTFSSPEDVDYDFIEAIGKTTGEEVLEFHWKGENNSSDRKEAGQNLAEIIKNHEFEDGEDLHIIAHSHGGNVIKEATQHMSEGDKKIDTLVMLGVPHRDDHVLNENALASDSTLLNLFDTQDWVQSTAAGIDSDAVHYNNYYPLFGLPLTIDYKPTSQTIPGFKNIEIEQKKIIIVDDQRSLGTLKEKEVGVGGLSAHLNLDTKKIWDSYISEHLTNGDN